MMHGQKNTFHCVDTVLTIRTAKSRIVCFSLHSSLFVVLWFVSGIPSVWAAPVILWKHSLFVDSIFEVFRCVFHLVWFKVLKSIVLGDVRSSITQCSQPPLWQLTGQLISGALQAGRFMGADADRWAFRLPVRRRRNDHNIMPLFNFGEVGP